MFLLCEFTSEKTTILLSFFYSKGPEFNLIFYRSGGAAGDLVCGVLLVTSRRRAGVCRLKLVVEDTALSNTHSVAPAMTAWAGVRAALGTPGPRGLGA